MKDVKTTSLFGYKINSKRLLPVGAFLKQGTVSSIPIVFSWSDSIRPEGFMSSVLLWLVIIVAVVGVGFTVVVVIIVAVVVVVESSFVLDGKIRLPSSGPQFGDSTSLSKAS
ncbi:hypothetical protein Tco_0216227 [Tanacetum coccineum]